MLIASFYALAVDLFNVCAIVVVHRAGFVFVLHGCVHLSDAKDIAESNALERVIEVYLRSSDVPSIHIEVMFRCGMRTRPATESTYHGDEGS